MWVEHLFLFWNMGQSEPQVVSCSYKFQGEKKEEKDRTAIFVFLNHLSVNNSSHFQEWG